MFDKLKKLLEGGVAQVNPWDNGKTFQSVVNNRTPQQQNAVQQQQLQARQFNAARPQQAPQQNFTDKLRDILDANSQADKFRRAQMGQATSYQEQQAKNPNAYNQVTGMASKITNTGPVGLFNDVRSKGFGTLVNPNDLIRRGNPFAGAADVARQESNKLVQQNPAILNDPTTKSMYEMANTPRGLQDAAGRAITTVGNAPVIRDIKEAPGINVLNDMLISPILRTTANSLARVGSAGSGNQSYSTGVKGAAELGSDIYNVATMATAPAASKVLSQGGQAALRAIPGAAGRGFLAGSGANVQQQLADGANLDDISLQDAALSGGLGGIVNAGLPIASGAIGRQLGKGFDALGNLIHKPRSVAEIAQEVATARQPAIANNAPRTRVAPDGTSLPPRSASQIAQELADSQARAIDPNVQARRVAMEAPRNVAPAQPRINMHPDDQRILADFNDIANGVYTPDPRLQRQIELDATRIAEKHGIPLKNTTQEQADVFDNVLQRGVTKPEFAPKPPRATQQLAPKSNDPLEALKVEARQATGARSDYSPENLQANRQIRAKNASSITYADKKAIKPDELVTVYRAVPGKAKGGLTEGDWVTPNKEQARLFMKQSWAQDDTGAKIVTKKVKASELRYHADDAKGYVDDELLYVPKSDPLEALKQEARKYKSADEFVNSQVSRPKTTDNVWQDTLPSGTRPDSIKKVTKSGGNPLYHDTTADGVLGILDSGEIKASQAPFSSIAGQGKRVSTTRNFDNYSRYNKSPYRLVIDESKTGQRAIPDNREEFESIFRKGVSTKAVNSVAIDTTNPALLDDIRSGKLKSVIESAKKKGITVEPFEGKVLPNEGANAEVQTMTSRAFSEAFPEYKTRISQLTDLYNQAVGSKATKPKAYYQNVPKSYTEPKKTAFEQNTGVVAPTRAKATIQESVVKAGEQPKAPVLEQATPGEIKISSAAESSKVGAKQRLKDGREQLVNRFAPVEDLVSKIEKETGTPLRPSKNPLSYVRQYLGGGGIANAKIDDELTPIIKQTKQFDGLREYLVAKRMNELADRGMSKRADDVLEGINRKYGAEVGNFEKVAKELYAYQNKQLDELVDVGVLSKQAAENIRAKNQFYVPFNRVIPGLEDFAGTKGGNAIGRNGQPIKAIKGSDKDIIDPIESMIRNTYDIQATVQKQKVMSSLRDLAPDEFTVPAKASLNKNRVGMFVDGEKVILETSEPLARALNSMAEEQMNMAVRVMSLPAKALRSGATSLNVAFALPNVLRDQLSAAVNSKYGGVPIYDFVSGLSSVIGKDDVYKKWIMSGADQASFFAQDRTTLQRGVKDITGGAGYKVGKLVKSPLELFRIIGQFSEEGSRVGVYKRALKGATKEFGNLEDATLAAAKESREATIDFARRGSKMKAANALIPFLNARLQGTLKLANSFKERPVQTGAVGMAIAGLPAAALYLHNSQYPEYNEIPDYVRRENFIIMTGNKNTPFIKIPKGEVGKIFGNPVESFLAQMSSEDPEWKSTVGTLVDSFLPVGSVEDPGKFVTDLMPTAASVPLQMTANFDTFRGLPIVSQWQKDLPPEQQFTSYNTETGKKIGAALGVSPAMLEFGIGGITGGLGRQALQLGDIATGNKVATQDLPVISRFAGEQKDLSKSAGEVYDQLDKDKQKTARDNYKLKQAIKNGDLSGIEGMDKTKANRLVRSVKEDEIKKTLNPTEKALWGMSKEDLENYEGKYGKEASKVLGLKDSLNTSKEAKTNKEKYEKAFEDFNDPDNGYSRVEKVKKREELKRLTVQKDYDEDTTMLHGMSKEDVWGFLSTYEDGKAMADKLLALDDALTAAGVQDKNKFRDKYGNITIKPKEKSSGGSKAKTVKGQAEAVSSERKLRDLLANTNNKASYRKPATQSAKVGLKKFAVKSAGLTSKKGA